MGRKDPQVAARNEQLEQIRAMQFKHFDDQQPQTTMTIGSSWTPNMTTGGYIPATVYNASALTGGTTGR